MARSLSDDGARSLPGVVYEDGASHRPPDDGDCSYQARGKHGVAAATWAGKSYGSLQTASEQTHDHAKRKYQQVQQQ